MKLYSTFPAHFISYPALITATICGVSLENVFVGPDSDMAKDAAFKTKKAHWNFPVLETADGQIISQSYAISQFLAREANREDLFGHNAFEAAQIDQFAGIAQSGIWQHSYSVALTTFGWVVDPVRHQDALKVIKEQCKVLNDALKDREFLVGGRFTLADITVWTALFLPFTLALDPGFRKAMPHVSAWFERIAKMPEVAQHAGHVKLPAKSIKPAAK